MIFDKRVTIWKQYNEICDSNMKLNKICCEINYNFSFLKLTCWATTESTSSSILLNSSKQAQAPEEARPLKNWNQNSKHTVLKVIIINSVVNKEAF